ncbi:bifunctional metallophosphatase/5'-nucleotidase [Streptococcus dentiloxodontae]
MKEAIRILHLNDLHSHFEHYPQVKAFFEQESQTKAEVIKLDLGDNVDKSHPMTDATSGRFNVALMNELGIDYATIGNNEGIGLSKAELNELYREANFTVILNNLKEGGKQPKWAQPFFIHETKKGHKIAFLAYTHPYYSTYAPNGWQVLEPIAELVKDLARPEVATADLVIVLSHLGIRFDEKIAETFSQVDLIIGSHTHHLFEEGKQVNGVYLAAADRYGEYAGRIDLELEDGLLRACTIEAVPTKTMPMDKEDEDFIKAIYEEGYRHLAKEKVVNLGCALSFDESFDLILSAVRQESNSQLTLLNTGLLLKPFEAEVTKADLHAALPHQMRLIRLIVTGQELLTICREIFSKVPFLQHQKIKGMGFRGETFGSVLSGGFAYKNEEIVYNNKAISLDETFSLVLVDQYYFASYFPALKEHEAELLFPDLLREAVAHYLKKLV